MFYKQVAVFASEYKTQKYDYWFIKNYKLRINDFQSRSLNTY